MFLFLLLFFQSHLQPQSYAQQKGSEVTETVDLYIHSDAKKQSTLTQIKKADEDLAKEKAELEKLQTPTADAKKDDCAEEELRIRKEDADFYETNKNQINDLVATVRKGLKVQAEILHGFEQGKATNDPEDFEKYTNTDGKPDQSEYIEIKVAEGPADTAVKKIYVKDLIRYIKKFETEAKTVSDDPKAIDAFVEQYRQSKTATDPSYFNMTLDQALKAYAGCVNGCLNSVFQVSYHQQQKRILSVGAGKHMFRLTTTTVLGVDHKYPNAALGSQLSQKRDSGDTNLSVNMVQDFGEAMDLAAEDAYWKVIRDQQLTINGIPIDGYLRRVYFDEKRSLNCPSYTFNENSTPGPFLSYDQKTECRKVGIQVQSASIQKVKEWAEVAGPAPVGSIFDLTEGVKRVANGQMNHTDDFNTIAQALGISHHDVVSISINYTCGCDKHVMTFTQASYKLSGALTFGDCSRK